MLKNCKRALSLAIAVCLVFSLMGGMSVNAQAQAAAPAAKNLIILVPDGMNSNMTTLTRWVTGSKLTLDEMLVGGVINYNSNSVITDSAPAATAFATGYKTDNKYIGVKPSEITIPNKAEVSEENAFVPVATLLEAAKLQGKATGMIATSNIQHATPAGFSSHNFARSDYFDIAEQQVFENINVVFGGGKQYLVPGETGRKDGADLVQELKGMGYSFVEDTNSMKQLDASKVSKVWGLFAPDAMAYDMDRNPDKEPSLSEMTQKALDILSRNNNGFFLFVEGSKIDWAAHANDPVGVVSDVKAFDKAVKVALDYAKKDKNTLVLAFADHGTGGMTIGNAATSVGYDSLQLPALVDRLRAAQKTGEGITSLIKPDMSNLSDVLAYCYSLGDASQEEVDAVKKQYTTDKAALNSVVGPMLSKRTCIGWTTTGHTGEDINLYAFGLGKPSGLIDNTDIAKIAAAAMGISLDETNNELFVDAGEVIGELNAAADLDVTDPANPKLVITKGNTVAELPASTNKLIISGKTQYLNGLTILSKNGNVYVPRQVIDILKNMK